MICSTCKIDKEAKYFKVRSDNGNFRKQCHDCHKTRRTKTRSEWDNTRKDKRRNLQLKYLYGISLEEYNKLFNEQEGKCKICGIHQSQIVNSLHVDHNHLTGKVRGLLCYSCNHALGALKENPEIVQNMLNYINDYTEK